MDSLTVYHLARELDARWKGGTIRAGHLDRDARRVMTRRGAGYARWRSICRHPMSSCARERTRRAAGRLRGGRSNRVSAPEDDRRLIIALAREGKFRGSVSKRALLEVSLLPQARAALAHESGRAFARDRWCAAAAIAAAREF